MKFFFTQRTMSLKLAQARDRKEANFFLKGCRRK
jgi:hypothetical protein